MDEFEVSYTIEDSEQFWSELEDICAAKCTEHQLIDNTLRAYLHFCAKFKHEFLQTEYEVARCSERLLRSETFQKNKDYVRIQIVYSLMQEEDPATLHVIASFLLFDGRDNEATFEMMNNEGCFGKLLELIRDGMNDDARLQRLLLELLYESSRMQRLSAEDLGLVDDALVDYLFQIIEQLSDDVDDPYHYPVIRVLLVLNEQYMVASTTSPVATEPPLMPLTNRVIKLLSTHGQHYMTFGENIILLLNRETETSLQLLILKLLYLLFTTRATYEYFYTNDLHVLLDVIIRNLLDLPNELVALRHTYLRVLYPLLAHTQLSQPPHYKRHEITKVLAILGGSSNAHWEPADVTTVRLVERVATVPWLQIPPSTTTSPSDSAPTDNDVARKLLGISLTHSQAGSSVSVMDVAAVTELPGVQTPSKKTESAKTDLENGAAVEENGAKEGVKEVKVGPPVVRRRQAPLPPPPPVHTHPHSHLNPQSPPAPKTEKKQPPKAPPRRRTKLKALAASVDLEAAVEGAGL